MIRYLLGFIALESFVAGCIGGLFEFGLTWVVTCFLVCAFASIGWSLLAWLDDHPDDNYVAPRSFAETWDSAADAMEGDDDHELPYIANGPRPHWNTTIWGAPE